MPGTPFRGEEAAGPNWIACARLLIRAWVLKPKPLHKYQPFHAPEVCVLGSYWGLFVPVLGQKSDSNAFGIDALVTGLNQPATYPTGTTMLGRRTFVEGLHIYTPIVFLGV